MKERYIERGILKVIKRGVYAGSFDPVTRGHMWIIQRAALLLDELIIGIGDNPDKKYTFSPEERIAMIEESVEQLYGHGGYTRLEDEEEMTPIHNCKIYVVHFENQFLIDFAVRQDAEYIIRGVRDANDLSYEQRMCEFNSNMETGNGRVTTLVMLPPSDIINTSSSFVKGLCGPEYWQHRVQRMVPPAAFKKILEWQGCPEWEDYPNDLDDIE